MTTETDLLISLGIVDTATQQDIINGTKRLLLLDASAHMDWDWLLPFPVLTSGNTSVSGGGYARASWYFKPPEQKDPGVGCVNDILNGAAALLSANSDYRYSVCETGFLRGFATANPAGFEKLVKLGKAGARLRSEGGGITSPDNLLPNGEAFIRNYLEGHAWIAQSRSSIPAGMTLWIPDDFGHDPQLPVAAEAMGMIAAGFERLPGNAGHGVSPQPLDGDKSLLQKLSADKIDFTWTAADGSAMSGHWLIGGYGQGNTVYDIADIYSYLDMNLGVSPTPYIYVPVLSDFSLPNTKLPGIVEQWNTRTSQITKYENVIAVCGSFEVYAQLLQFHQDKLVAPYGEQFNANPFWTGCYGSRPGIKVRHHSAARNLLAAEVFSLLADIAQPGGGSAALATGMSYAKLLSEAWNILLPSTHHDYITGTADPDVFHSEQMELLDQADDRAKNLRRDTMRIIANAINTNADPASAIAAFNPLGFSRSGIAEISAEELVHAGFSMPTSGGQTTAEGNLLLPVTVPPLGYQTVYWDKITTPSTPASIDPNAPTGSCVFTNGLVRAVLSPGKGGIFGLTSVTDLQAEKELVPQGAVMNELLFYADGGDEYQFGMESMTPSWTLTDVSDYCSAPSLQVLESGPLRVVVRTTFHYDDSVTQVDYVQDYMLYAGESQLRMRSSGAAPIGAGGMAVVTAFPLLENDSIDTLVRGTPNHWTDLMPPIYWNDQMFMPTHHFVIPKFKGKTLCAMYHSDIPCWGLSNQAPGTSTNSSGNTLYGNLWRNTNGSYYGWVYPQGYTWPMGTDPDVHVREYALRMPTGLGAPETGQPLQEALSFADQLVGFPVAPWTALLPDSLSLASSSDPAALIRVMKPGTVHPDRVVLRVYQPTNGALNTTLTINPLLNPSGKKLNVAAQTALEHDLPKAKQKGYGIVTTPGTIRFTAQRALTTLTLKRK